MDHYIEIYKEYKIGKITIKRMFPSLPSLRTHLIVEPCLVSAQFWISKGASQSWWQLVSLTKTEYLNQLVDSKINIHLFLYCDMFKRKGLGIIVLKKTI